jgi:transposase
MRIRAKISKYKIEKILKHFCVDVDASKTAPLIGLNRNTVSHWHARFRLAIYRYRMAEFQKLLGEIEPDESYFGARRRRGFRGRLERGRGTMKQPVFGVFERNGKVYAEIIPNCKKKTLQAVILGKASIESVMCTDGWRGYSGLVDVGYDRRFRVNHGNNEFSRGNGVHINGIESFRSFTKRRPAKFNGVKRNFGLRLKECEWRWDRKPDVLQDELRNILKNYAKIRWLSSLEPLVISCIVSSGSDDYVFRRDKLVKIIFF